MFRTRILMLAAGLSLPLIGCSNHGGPSGLPTSALATLDEGSGAADGAAATSISDLPGSLPSARTHRGDGGALTWSVEYFDSWGQTVVDYTGAHFHHDRLHLGVTDDPTWIFPEEYWGTYAMYYTDTTVRFRITLTNASRRVYRNLQVVAIQEYLQTDKSAGEWLTPDAATRWDISQLRGRESTTLVGSLYADAGHVHGGLDQTHLQIFRRDRSFGNPARGSMIAEDTQAGIFCPPPAAAGSKRAMALR